MSRRPVFLQPATKVITGLFQTEGQEVLTHFFLYIHRSDNNSSDKIPVLVEDDVPHLERALSKFLSRHHLHVHVLRLRLAARLDQTLQHLGQFTLSEFKLYDARNLGGGDLQVD